ncbi:MAG: alkaline shock response membrane anchor protein AmaP [Christensenellaceae bacterium]|jgi:uncharacterized alkaline shock family protein YloU
MKMRVGTRIVFSFYLLIIIVLCAAVIVAAFGLIPEADVQAVIDGFTSTWYKYIWAAAALLMLVVSVCLMFFGIKKNEVVPRAVVLDTSSNGNVEITIDALKELAHNYLRNISGIVVQRIDPKPLAFRSAKLTIHISVRQETEIPALTAQITTEIKEYFEKYAGVSIDEVVLRVLPLKQQTPQS